MGGVRIDDVSPEFSVFRPIFQKCSNCQKVISIIRQSITLARAGLWCAVDDDESNKIDLDWDLSIWRNEQQMFQYVSSYRVHV